MSTPDPELTSEAKRAWLTAVVQAPNGWRARATSAAGLLSAAAAATLVGLLTKAPVERTYPEIVGTVVAGIAFLAAVVLLLLAAVHPSPDGGPDSADNRTQAVQLGYTAFGFADLVEVYCRRDSKPVRRLTVVGGWVGAVAVFATVATGTSIFFTPSYTSQIEISDEAVKAAFKGLCPAASFPLAVRVKSAASDLTRVRISGQSCGRSEAITVSLPSSSVITSR